MGDCAFQSQVQQYEVLVHHLAMGWVRFSSRTHMLERTDLRRITHTIGLAQPVGTDVPEKRCGPHMSAGYPRCRVKVPDVM